MSSKGAGWGTDEFRCLTSVFCALQRAGRENRWVQVSPVHFLRPTVGGYGKTAGYRCLPSIFCAQPLAGRENCWVQASPVHFLRPTVDGYGKTAGYRCLLFWSI